MCINESNTDSFFNPSFFLTNPNMAQLTARKNTTELLIMTESTDCHVCKIKIKQENSQ